MKSDKTAFLVKVSMMTRVIASHGDEDGDIVKLAKKNLLDKIENDLYEQVEDIEEDFECPYDPQTDE